MPMTHSADRSKLHKIFILSPGPKYNLENAFKERCESLSLQYRGRILTSGPKYERQRYGEFDVICIKDARAKSWASTVGFVLISLWEIIKAIIIKDRYRLFVTYDPLKTGLIGTLVSAITKIKLVVEVNGDYMSDAIYAPIDNFYKRHLRRLLMIWVEKFVLNHASGIKLLYPAQIDSFKPLPHQPYISCFPNYVNAGAFSNNGDTKEVLFAGFPFAIKGVDILIAAFKIASTKHPDWTLKILGHYPDKTQLNQHIDGHPKIHHLKAVDPSEMPLQIGACGIFVLPSRTEAMGRVLVEAMAAGKPRIGANVAGIPTVIDNNSDGLLFESENVEDLANKLDALMSDENLRTQIGKNARKRYLEHFKPEFYFHRLNAFYSDVINSSGPAD